MSRYFSIGWVALNEEGEPTRTQPNKQWWGQPSLNAPRVYKSESSAKRYGYPKEVFIKLVREDN
jgi:hypothetical protein